MRNALVVGINNYHYLDSLKSCVNDAHSVAKSLQEEIDGKSHYKDVIVVPGFDNDPNCQIEIETLQPLVKNFFMQENQLSLFYFSGHASDGYLKCTDSTDIKSPGLHMGDLMHWVKQSKARNIIIILDCCHAGEIAENMFADDVTSLPRGVTILAASDSDQKAAAGAENRCSVFTDLMLQGLNGSASNALGAITPAALFSKIDESLGMTNQRPVFKSNTVGFVDIKHVIPKIGLAELKDGLKLFDSEDNPLRSSYRYPLDYTYEEDRSSDESKKWPAPILENVVKFKKLQKMCSIELVRPCEPHEHMYWAAVAEDQKGTCELTEKGKHYLRLVRRGVL